MRLKLCLAASAALTLIACPQHSPPAEDKLVVFSGCSHLERTAVTLHQIVDVKLAAREHFGFLVLAEDRSWLIRDEVFVSDSFHSPTGYEFRFKVADLMGRRWEESGQMIEEKVFQSGRMYDLYFAQELGTEPENTLSCLIRIEVITS